MKIYMTLMFFIFFNSAINAVPINHDQLKPVLDNMMKNWTVLFSVFSDKFNYREYGEKKVNIWNNAKEAQKFGFAKSKIDGYVKSTRKVTMDHSDVCKIDFLKDLLKKHAAVQTRWSLLDFTCQDRLSGELKDVDTAIITQVITDFSK